MKVWELKCAEPPHTKPTTHQTYHFFTFFFHFGFKFLLGNEFIGTCYLLIKVPDLKTIANSAIKSDYQQWNQTCPEGM